MIQIEIQKIPNQEFSVEINEVRYLLRIRTFKEMTFMDITINDELVKGSVRCCPNTLVIPYDYLTEGGNFIWQCLNNDYPSYEKFGDTQFLNYLTDEEISELGL